MGIASSCEIFTWHMPLGETFIEQRDIACQRLDGGYEKSAILKNGKCLIRDFTFAHRRTNTTYDY